MAARPRGMWPAEGAVAQDIVGMVARAGIIWMASDEEVLARSLGETSFSRNSQEVVQEADTLYRPYVVSSRNDSMYTIFRDKVISDKVGFTYNGVSGTAAAKDFVNRILSIRDQLAEQEAEGPNLVSVILDGENAWEHYPICETYEDVSRPVSENRGEQVSNYRWRVRATDRAGNQSKDSNWRYFECPDVTPPSIPTRLSPGTQDPNNPEYGNCPWKLEWTSVSDPSGVRYNVSLEKLSSQGWQYKDSWYPAYGTQLEASGRSENMNYRWHVRAQDGAGNWSGWSGYLYHSTSVW